MAAIFTSHHFTAFTFLLLFLLRTLAADPISSFSFRDLGKDPKFKSNVALYGNAEVVKGGGSAVRFSGSGRVMYKKPIKLVEGKPRQLVSFSTYFAFSISSENQDGLAFVMVPTSSGFSNSSSGFSSGLRKGDFLVIAFEVGTSRDGRNGDSTNFNVVINGDSSSSVKMALRGEEKLHAWVDYEANSQRLEVRLSQNDHSRPFDSLFWHKIDLSNVKKEEDEEIFVGFRPVKGNSTSETCFLYSWSFVSRHLPRWMHSEPLDPKAVGKNTENLRVKPRSCDYCVLRVLAAMVFGGGFGALTAFTALYLWSMFGNRRPVVPEECVGEETVEFEYKKVNIIVDKSTIEGGKN